MNEITFDSTGGDDTAALQAALTSAAGKRLKLTSTSYNVSGSVYANAPTDIIGNGAAISILPGVDLVDGIICHLNGGYGKIENVNFVGNNYSTVSEAIGAVKIRLDATASAPIGDTIIGGCTFSNFQQDHWVRAVNASNYAIGGLELDHCRFDSVFGNSRSYSDVTMASVFVDAWGDTLGSGGSIKRVVAKNNVFNGSGVASAIRTWGNVGTWRIEDNDFNDVAKNITTLMNTYVCLAYTPNVSGAVKNGGGIFRGNRNRQTNSASYIGPGAVLYAATTGDILSSANDLQGIQRNDNSTLRRAALSFNGTQKITCIGNAINSNATGIAISGFADQLTYYYGTSAHLVADNSITSDAGGAVGIIVSWNDAGTAAPHVYLSRNAVKLFSGTNVVSAPGSYGSVYNDTLT